MPEFLLELLSEDIPARMQVQAAEDLKRLVVEKLTEAGLTFESAVAHSTPRRLTLVIDDLPAQAPDRTDERKGPKLGAPDAAIQGFLKSAGLDSLDQAELRETDKGQVYFATKKIAGEPTDRVLMAAIQHATDNLPWPKSMRWGSSSKKWVRPLHQTLAIFDGKPIGDTNTTIGHRFLSPEPFEVRHFKDYEQKLHDHHVVLDREKRKWHILGDAKRMAEEHQVSLVADEALLEEVIGLVEWPVVLIAGIDHQFMDLPPEVRRTTMRANQKYFTLDGPDGKPAARFLLVANMQTADGGAEVIAGNERVLRARLADARFFYDQDRKTPLRDLRPKLEKIAFHAKLGSVSDRVERLEKLVAHIAPLVERAEVSMAVEAARLCKCDLVTGMVGEFPELQGVMGRYYALDQEAPHQVADAIRDHYKPLGPGDVCPTEPVSVALALAEKIDTLVGFFAIGETPTGSKDPYALRRAALGVIRLIVENGLRIQLGLLIRAAIEPIGILIYEDAIRHLNTDVIANRVLEFKVKFSDDGNVNVSFIEQLGTHRDAIIAEDGNAKKAVDKINEYLPKLLPFFADRMKPVLKERGVRHDLIDAVFALGGEDDLVRLLARVQALQDFLATEDGANLLTAYRRAANILKIEEKKDGVSYEGPVDMGLLALPEERALVDALEVAGAAVDPLIAAEDFQGAMARFAALRPVVDAFFDRVTVNADEAPVRANRLRLLSRIRGTLNKIADFSRIV